MSLDQRVSDVDGSTRLATQPDDDADFQPIAALNDLLFCERRCALHRIEQVWEDNVATLEGTLRHKRADAGKLEHTADGRVARAVLLRCQRLRLAGKADVVEFHRQDDGSEVPFPVEYKRGRRRKWDNDDVQLCAQALCLEEMLGVTVPRGAIFHVKSKRRRDVAFTPELRAKTEQTARRLHALLAAGATPPPVLKPRCRGCSLRELCLPELLPDAARLQAYREGLYQIADG
jgi:CRISPR-associated exonuclease Cas4